MEWLAVGVVAAHDLTRDLAYLGLEYETTVLWRRVLLCVCGVCCVYQIPVVCME